jgi:uncharacterized FlaG/YvyC family protein
MDLTGIHRVPQALPAEVAAPVDHAAQSRDVVRAVKALNQTEMFGQDNELEFRRDPNSRRMVVRVINRKTKEIISQVPPEYVLRLAEDFKQS